MVEGGIKVRLRRRRRRRRLQKQQGQKGEGAAKEELSRLCCVFFVFPPAAAAEEEEEGNGEGLSFQAPLEEGLLFPPFVYLLLIPPAFPPPSSFPFLSGKGENFAN